MHLGTMSHLYNSALIDCWVSTKSYVLSVLRGLPPAFVLRIAAMFLKYSGPRSAVFVPPRLPSIAAGARLSRSSARAIAAAKTSVARWDRPSSRSDVDTIA